MAYTTKSWGNDPVGGTPLNAAGLNDWEARIATGFSAGQFRSYLYATDFGVLADNSTDDRAALQAAIDYADTTVVAGRDSNTILLPEGNLMVGNQVKVKNGVALRGVSARGSQIKAISGTFPTNTPVVRLGDGTTIGFDMRLEHMAVDCSDIVGSTGVYSTECQEGSGLFHVKLFSHSKYGAWFDGAGCSQFRVSESEVYCGAIGADAGIFCDSTAGTSNIEWVTTNCADKAGSAGLHLRNANYSVYQIHNERSVDGIYFEGGAGIVDGLLGNASVVNLLHIGAGTSSVVARSVDRSGASNTIVDDFTGQTFTDSNIAEYVQKTMRVGYITFNDGCITTLTSSTGGRRNAVTMGQGAQAYDFTLHKPIWSDGTNWRDASGAVV